MDNQQHSLETIQDIKKMMEKSSRFISLSGWSGISAGSCALLGAWFAHRELSSGAINEKSTPERLLSEVVSFGSLISHLFWIAILTFVAAFILAFLLSVSLNFEGKISALFT